MKYGEQSLADVEIKGITPEVLQMVDTRLQEVVARVQQRVRLIRRRRLLTLPVTERCRAAVPI